jgi:PPK2 family polyphosphate:nucleotide phosphotransferase
MRRHRVRPGARVRLDRFDPGDTGKVESEEHARAKLARNSERLAKLQDVLWAEGRHAVLIVLQGMDTAGKDGTVEHVMHGVNPTTCNVVSFKVPTAEEAAHDFLWRIHRATPKRGHITIFNRSHYEDVLVPFVHRLLPGHAIKARYKRINDFEHLLTQNDTVVLKFFLHISKKEQRQRLRERIEDPTKNWKFNENDLKERRLWGRYVEAYEELLTRCSTEHAPWYVIPSNHKWYRNLAVAEVIVKALRDLDCKYPRPALPMARLRRLLG